MSLMDIEIEEVNSFREFFDQLDDEFLIKLHLAGPYNLHRLCAMYALDLQMEKEAIENESFSNRRGMC